MVTCAVTVVAGKCKCPTVTERFIFYLFHFDQSQKQEFYQRSIVIILMLAPLLMLALLDWEEVVDGLVYLDVLTRHRNLR